MRIDALNSVNLVPTQLATVARAWSVGQLLDVLVIGPRGGNSTALKIGNDTLLAESSVSLPPGTRFTARVTTLDPLPVLVPTPQKAPTITPTPLQTGWIGVLAKQQPLAQSLQNVAAAAAPAARIDDQHALPLAPIHELLNSLPPLEDFRQAPALKTAMLNSGLLLEANLNQVVSSQTSSLPTNDMKWRLLSALAQISAAINTETPQSPNVAPATDPRTTPTLNTTIPTPAAALSAPPPSPLTIPHTTLVTHLTEAIANITARQLQSLDASAAGQTLGVFELPVKLDQQPGTIAIQYEERRHTSSDPTPAAYIVQLRVPVTPTSDLQARMTLIDNTLSATLWSADPGLRANLAQRLEDLRRQFTDQALQVGNLIVTEFDDIPDLALPSTHLLDLEA